MAKEAAGGGQICLGISIPLVNLSRRRSSEPRALCL